MSTQGTQGLNRLFCTLLLLHDTVWLTESPGTISAAADTPRMGNTVGINFLSLLLEADTL